MSKNNLNQLLCYGCKQRVQQVFNGQRYVNLCLICRDKPERQKESMLFFNEIILQQIKETEKETMNVYTLLDELREANNNYKNLELSDKDCGLILKYINQLKANQKKEILYKNEEQRKE